VPTIRYYEQIGLLPKAARRLGGHRLYGEADRRRLTFIRRCRAFGFPIEEVRKLAALVDTPEQDCVAGARGRPPQPRRSAAQVEGAARA
jgi:DNA-binding transcriptional MerR regulator